MPAVTTPATASTLAVLVTRIRELVSDPSTNVTTPRFSDTIIRARIDEILAEMWNKLTEDPTGYLVSDELTYTAEADSVAIDTGFEAHSIFKVEDYSDSANPVFIDYMSTLDLGRFPLRAGWCLLGGNIALRPKPDASKTLRIWFVKPWPRTSGAASSDTHVLPVSHEELICVGAAVRLQMIDSEVDPARLLHLEGLKEDFRNYAARVRGPMYVRNARHFL